MRLNNGFHVLIEYVGHLAALGLALPHVEIHVFLIALIHLIDIIQVKSIHLHGILLLVEMHHHISKGIVKFALLLFASL